MRICSPSFQLFSQQWEDAILQLNPSANTATFPSHGVKGPEEEKQQTQTQNVNPLIICERKDGFDAALIQITEPELTSEKNTKASSALLPTHPSILTFPDLCYDTGPFYVEDAVARATLFKVIRHQTTATYARRGETAHTHAPPTAFILLKC